MRIIEFVGKSGTGKSYRATEVAKKNNILYIIDDGLLITGNRIVAGSSAKRETTKFASVKTALFLNEEKTHQMKVAITKENPESILILGTSERMVERIVNQLELPLPCEFIQIEEIATREEIETAKRIREKEGKHIIPVPTFELKRDFSGYFIDKVMMLGGRGRTRKTATAEKSIVRPTYSYMGDFIIANRVITDIAVFAGESIDAVSKISLCNLKKHTNGVDIYMDIVVEFGAEIQVCVAEVITRVREAVERFTGINVINVQVYVKSLNISDQG